ncbi:MAG: hypothetical protein INQ03_00330 [Candidatus Heimdallarchaeota archaeon]|nr:hypothetical protein [Candidatus Heimdallarchaeota archaeon]
MKIMKISIPITLIAVLFLGTMSTSSAGMTYKNENGKIYLETDTLGVEVVGNSNIPAFTYWDFNDNDTKYKVSFDSVIEFLDEEENGTLGVYDLGIDKKVPTSQISLQSYSWEFSEFDTVMEGEETTEVHFNITSTIDKKADIWIQFRIHLTSDKEIKFDVVIDEYTFINDDALLALGFKLIASNDAEQEGDTVAFGNGYFQIEETATDANGTIGVGLSTGEDGGSKIYLAYEHFEGLMIHDPTLGVQAASLTATDDLDADDGSTDQNLGDDILPGLSKGELLSVSAVSTLLFIAIPALIYKSKR